MSEDFTKDIAKDLYSKLPRENFTTDDFIEYMKDKKAPMSVITDVLEHLKKMGFPFSKVIEKSKETFNNNRDKKMVTREDLNDYLIEHECDIFMDGPFIYNNEEWEIFGKLFIKKIEEKYDIKVKFNEEWYENIWNTLPTDITDDVVDLGLDALAEWINKYDIECDLN
ncbi:hypothetical protein UFOVP972_95 [uncultured Caudovirales phage]|uniref:Uncharacterized protein n=1 Tax=uncultured Caudovirales phage TaxID=2100421 RepID=A0A6J5Q5V5_9CAUD|nr:hypothetical protein UFOVP972_95 [uncultured Caudovirales phage]